MADEQKPDEQTTQILEAFSSFLEDLPRVLAEAIVEEMRDKLGSLLKSLQTADDDITSAVERLENSVERLAAQSEPAENEEWEPETILEPAPPGQAMVTRKLEEQIVSSVPELVEGTIIPPLQERPPAPPGYEWKSSIRPLGHVLRKKT